MRRAWDIAAAVPACVVIGTQCRCLTCKVERPLTIRVSSAEGSVHRSANRHHLRCTVPSRFVALAPAGIAVIASRTQCRPVERKGKCVACVRYKKSDSRAARVATHTQVATFVVTLQ